MVALRILLGMTQSAIFPGLSYLISTVRMSCLFDFLRSVFETRVMFYGSKSFIDFIRRDNSERSTSFECLFEFVTVMSGLSAKLMAF